MSDQVQMSFSTAANVGRVMMEGGLTLPRVEAVAAVLRAEGLLPKGGRGLSAPMISPSQALMFVLVTASTPRIQDTFDTVEKIGRMTNPACSQGLSSWLLGKIRNEGADNDIEDLLINPVGGYAVARLSRGAFRSQYFALPEFWHGRAGDELPGGGYIGHCGLIGGQLFKALARAIETVQVADGGEG